VKRRARILIAHLPSTLVARDLPDDSVYHANSTWTTHDDRTTQLPDLRGYVQVVSFVYTYCEHTCPTIIARLKAIESRIPADAPVRFTLVSLDPTRDTPVVLKAYLEDKGLDPNRWTMLTGSPGDVRQLSALFGVRYRPMGTSDIAHSNMITVLDRDGVIRYQMEGLNEDLKTILAAIAVAAEPVRSDPGE
jgi:protein SCO1/2